MEYAPLIISIFILAGIIAFLLNFFSRNDELPPLSAEQARKERVQKATDKIERRLSGQTCITIKDITFIFVFKVTFFVVISLVIISAVIYLPIILISPIVLF